MQIGGDSLDFDASNALEPPQFHLAATTTAAPYATATAQQQDSTAQQQDSTAQQQDLAQYIVTVYTSDLAGAGTDCSAYISIHGKHGDTGKQGMTVDTGAFARGSVKTALVEGQNVGQMLSICVGHNDQGAHLFFRFISSFMHHFIQAFTHACMRSFIHSFIRSLTHSLIRMLSRSTHSV